MVLWLGDGLDPDMVPDSLRVASAKKDWSVGRNADKVDQELEEDKVLSAQATSQALRGSQPLVHEPSSSDTKVWKRPKIIVAAGVVRKANSIRNVGHRELPGKPKAAKKAAKKAAAAKAAGTMAVKKAEPVMKAAPAP